MNEVISYNNYLKTTGELPKNITHSQYLELLEQPKLWCEQKKKVNVRDKYLILRDTLLMEFAWETGGRIGDITRIRKEHINFDTKILILNIQKSSRTIKINLSERICYDLMKFYNQFPDKEPFMMTPTNAWYLVQKYGKLIGIPHLHPHMFRHGLALYLLGQSVPIPIISYRLGHSNVKTTMNFYLKVTPEIERQFMEGVNLH